MTKRKSKKNENQQKLKEVLFLNPFSIEHICFYCSTHIDREDEKRDALRLIQFYCEAQEQREMKK